MRNAPARALVFAIVSVVALGCDQGFDDASPAPMCTKTMGCPSGTVCVDGVRCEAIPDASIPRSPLGEGLIGPGAGVRPGPRPRRDGGAQQDAGVQGRDAGIGGGGGGCANGLSPCGGTCVNLSSDNANCGACGISCAGGQLCDQGFCCGGTDVVCGDRCTDLQTDPDNCGVCGFQCIVGLACVLGQCTPPSPTPQPF